MARSPYYGLMSGNRRSPEFIEAMSIPEPNTGCWLWLGAMFGDGYGGTLLGKKRIGAHRLSYETYKGDAPAGMVVHHKCQLPLCVNPDHLELVSYSDHAKEHYKLGTRVSPWPKKTHCIRGHELSGHNLQLSRTGVRSCRACRVIWTRNWKKYGKGSYDE